MYSDRGLLVSVIFLFFVVCCFSTCSPHTVVSVGQGDSWQSDFWDYRTESHCQGFPMADMKKAHPFPQRHTSFTPSSSGAPMPLHLHTVHTQSRQQQMASRPGCVVAGLNPHVNSECVPCSQWLSSAATGLQPAGGRKGKVREGPPCIGPPPPCVSTGLSDLSKEPKPSLHGLHSAICVWI